MKKNPLIAFSNITRVRILACLSSDCHNVGCLIQKCQLSQSAVSQHLQKLKEIGFIDYDVRGQNRVYRLIQPQAGIISQQILQLINR
ncbi:MAG TPA: metalloregulator ArsR/SmtB family transcription factor [bacterium]|nr:metalloregulator ArsR/SmtB family transcription factor [bacterium]HPN67647.1 metalloregulator ArsR/SmtB family transcription factor [bacterium]